MINVKVKKTHAEAKVPTYAHPNDAAMDLYASQDMTISPNQRVSVPTGVCMHIPDGYVGLIWDKSGLSHKHGLKTLGGVIDAGYRGEIMVGVINLSDQPYTVNKHNKIAQMIIQEKPQVTLEEVVELEDSVRGTGGFGSTGK